MEPPVVRRNVHDEVLIDTIDGSTNVLSVNDVERGEGDNNAVGGRADYDARRGLARVASLTVDKDDSCAGSTVVGSGSSQGRQDSDTKGSPKSLPK